MKGFLDPVKNAKVIGRLFILGVIIQILLGGVDIFTLVLSLIVGIGLIKQKVWAIYVLFILSLVGFIGYFIAGGSIAALIFPIIYILLSIRFGTARKEFEKITKENKKKEEKKEKKLT